MIGDTVNVAARVEQLTKTTGDTILLTQQTADALVARPHGLTDRGSHELKGKSAAVKVFGLALPAACSVMSEISVRLLPSVVPSLEIHTSTFDVSVRSWTSMRLCPGCNGVVGVSSVVSANAAGFSVGEERICTSVPVLDMSMVTALSAVGSDRCSNNPSPSMKFGNGTASL